MSPIFKKKIVKKLRQENKYKMLECKNVKQDYNFAQSPLLEFPSALSFLPDSGLSIPCELRIHHIVMLTLPTEQQVHMNLIELIWIVCYSVKPA